MYTSGCHCIPPSQSRAGIAFTRHCFVAAGCLSRAARPVSRPLGLMQCQRKAVCSCSTIANRGRTNQHLASRTTVPDRSGSSSAMPWATFALERQPLTRIFCTRDRRLKPDSRTLHCGKPVIRGTKWAANKWIRQYPMREPRPQAWPSAGGAAADPASVATEGGVAAQ